jgi:hypothetical protein
VAFVASRQSFIPSSQASILAAREPNWTFISAIILWLAFISSWSLFQPAGIPTFIPSS